jgi:uncharacterized membrane protein
MILLQVRIESGRGVTVTSTLANERNQVQKPKGSTSRRLNTLIWSLVAVAVTAGFAFRLFGLDRKLIWADETVTAFFLSGHSDEELQQLEGKVVTADQLMKFQRLNTEKTAADALRQLSNRQAEQGPIYYMLARAWAVKMGGELKDLRLFSAVLGILLIPATFYLCMELFGSTLTAGVAAALVALSPLALLYSQVARPYCLWCLEEVVASIALLQALRSGGFMRWAIFTALSLIGLYTQFLNETVLAAQVAFVALQSRFRISKRNMAFCCSLLVAELLYSPWFRLIATGHNDQSNWTEKNIGAMRIGQGVASDLGRVFVLGPNQDPSGQIFQGCFTALCLALVAFSFLFIVGTELGRRARYLLCLALVPAAIVVGKDLQAGHFASIIDRYLLVSLLAVQLCVGFLIGSTLQSRKANVRKASVSILLGLILAQAGSCIWYLNKKEFRFVGIGNGRIMVARSSDPISIRAAKLQLMTLAHVMDGNTRLVFSFDTSLADHQKIKDYLLMTPDEEVVHEYEGTRFSARPLGTKGCLWLLSRAKGTRQSM